jgi:hypothetical protein
MLEHSPRHRAPLDRLGRLARPSSALLLGILALGAWLRLRQLEQPFVDALSWRQASVAMMADNFYRKSWNPFLPEVSWNGPGPSYQGRELQTVSYLAALLYNLVGQHDWVGRAVAVAFSLWGIFTLYLLIRTVWDERHALAGAAILALLPGSAFVGRSFIPDPVMVSLATTGAWLFIRAFRTGQTGATLLAAVVLSWAGLTKITALVVGLPIAYAAFAVMTPRGLLQARRLRLLLAAGLIVLVPVAAYYLWARYLALSYPPYHFAGSGNWVWDSGLQQWLQQRYFFARLSDRIMTWSWGAIGAVVIFIGLLVRPPGRAPDLGVERQAPQPAPVAPWLFHCWVAGCLLFYLIGARELVENPWNLHLVDPAAAALAGRAVVVLGSLSIGTSLLGVLRVPRSLAVGLVSGGLIALVGLGGARNASWLYHPYEAAGHRLGLALRDLSQPDDLVVTIGFDVGNPVVIYYSGRRGWTFPPAAPDRAWNRLPERDAESEQMFDDLRQQGATWFGMVTSIKGDPLKSRPQFVSYLERNCQPTARAVDWTICRIVPADRAERRSEIGRADARPAN